MIEKHHDAFIGSMTQIAFVPRFNVNRQLMQVNRSPVMNRYNLRKPELVSARISWVKLSHTHFELLLERSRMGTANRKLMGAPQVLLLGNCE